MFVVQKESHANQNTCKLAELRLKSEEGGFLSSIVFAGARRYFEINCCNCNCLCITVSCCLDICLK